MVWKLNKNKITKTINNIRMTKINSASYQIPQWCYIFYFKKRSLFILLYCLTRDRAVHQTCWGKGQSVVWLDGERLIHYSWRAVQHQSSCSLTSWWWFHFVFYHHSYENQWLYSVLETSWFTWKTSDGEYRRRWPLTSSG